MAKWHYSSKKSDLHFQYLLIGKYIIIHNQKKFLETTLLTSACIFKTVSSSSICKIFVATLKKYNHSTTGQMARKLLPKCSVSWYSRDMPKPFSLLHFLVTIDLPQEDGLFQADRISKTYWGFSLHRNLS